MSMEEFAFSLQMRDTLKRMIRVLVDAERPRYRYATVESVDYSTRKAAVVHNGETGSVQVNMGSIMPYVGQKVRVEGIGTDKFITDVYGKPYGYFADMIVDRLRVRSTADVAEAGADATDPVIFGDENGAHVAFDNNELIAFSAPGTRTPYGLNSGATIPLDQIGTGISRVPNLQWVTGSIQTATAKMATRVLVGERVITPVANTPTQGAVSFPAGYFDAVPTVVTSANSSVPGTTVTGTAPTGISTTGFTAVVTRTNTTVTGVLWVAIQM